MNNPVTDDGATLGRVLFYERALSANKTTSCASCHIQDRGFGDSARFSRGFAGGHTARHTMGLSNCAVLLERILFLGRTRCVA